MKLRKRNAATGATGAPGRRRLTIWLALIACAAALVAAGCGGSDDSSSTSGGDTSGAAASTTDGGSSGDELQQVDLMLSWIPKEEYAFLYLGKEKGIFERNGIDVEFQTTQGSTAAMQVLGTRKVDFLISGGPSLFSVVDQGLDMKMVALYLRSTPSMLLAWPDSGIRTINDLEGKTLILTPGDGFTPSWPCVARENGIDASTVKPLSVGVSARAQAFAAHKADAIPWYATSSIAAVEDPAGVRFVRIPGADFKCGQILGNGLLTRDDMIQSDPELVRKMVTAVTESWDAAVADPEAAARAIQPLLPGNEFDDIVSVIRTTNELGESENTRGTPTGCMSAEDWSTAVDVVKNSGVIRSPRPVEDYFTNEFIADCPS